VTCRQVGWPEGWSKQRWIDVAGWACAGAAALFALGYHLASSIFAPLNFDEAYNLQIPLNLYLSGRYQTWYDTPLLFPYQITTGPSVLLPIAGLFFVTGPSVRTARAVMTLFLVGYLWQAHKLSRRLAGRAGNWAFAAAAILFVVVPLGPWLSSVVLGELPGAFAFLVAVNLMCRALESDRRVLAFGAGLALGVAALCKIVLLMCAAGVFPALAVCSELKGCRKRAFTLGFLCLAGLLLPVATWELVKLGILGCDGHQDYLVRFWELISVGGSGLARDGSLQTAPSVARHIEVIAKELGEPVWAVYTGLGLASALILSVLARPPRPFALLSLALGTLLYWSWWLRLSTWLWMRHLSVGYVLYSLALPIVGAALGSDRRIRRELRALLLAAVIAAVVLTLPPRRFLVMPTTNQSTALLDQYATARLVAVLRTLDPSTVFWGFSWGQAPEISFLAQIPFRDITRHKPHPDEYNFLVLTSFIGGYTANLNYAKQYCDFFVVRKFNLELCLLRPDAPQSRDTTIHP
jgi:hypothetical protein